MKYRCLAEILLRLLINFCVLHVFLSSHFEVFKLCLWGIFSSFLPFLEGMKFPTLLNTVFGDIFIWFLVFSRPNIVNHTAILRVHFSQYLMRFGVVRFLTYPVNIYICEIYWYTRMTIRNFLHEMLLLMRIIPIDSKHFSEKNIPIRCSQNEQRNLQQH